MKKAVIRSTLILPVNIPRFVETAYSRGSDAITLDLEDSVPLAEKENARKLIKESIPMAARGGAYVMVRINNEPQLLPADVEASVHPGVYGISLPKTESPEDVKNLEALVEDLERRRGIEQGHVKLALIIESPRGLLNLKEIAGASPRIGSMSIGVEDYCLELGVEPSAEGTELFFPVSQVVTVCKAMGIRPSGLVGSIGDFRNLEGFERSATRARQLGCEGAGCIHPAQVEVLNRVFSLPPEKVAYMRRVVEVFEEGLEKGTASVNLDGKMVDIPVYNRAKVFLERADAIEALERRKKEALAGAGPLPKPVV